MKAVFSCSFLFYRSDDTARSEIESRGEPEGGEETPPPVNCKISLEDQSIHFYFILVCIFMQ